MPQEEINHLKLGENIRKFRMQKGLSVQDLSRISSVSTSYLSKLERGTTGGSPTIACLLKISSALDVYLDDLLNTIELSDISFTKYADRMVLNHRERGYQLHFLARKKVHNIITPFFAIFKKVYDPTAPIDEDSLEFLEHPGEEFIVVEEGILKIIFGKKNGENEFGLKEYKKDDSIPSLIVRERDSALFDSSIPHTYIPLSKDPDPELDQKSFNTSKALVVCASRPLSRIQGNALEGISTLL